MEVWLRIMVLENAEGVRYAFNDGDKYVAIEDIFKELLILRQVWRFVGMPGISVFEDNEGAIQLHVTRSPIPIRNVSI